jgi:hypothetical protein
LQTDLLNSSGCIPWLRFLVIGDRCSYSSNSCFVSHQALQAAMAKQMELEDTVEALQHRSSSVVRVIRL